MSTRLILDTQAAVRSNGTIELDFPACLASSVWTGAVTVLTSAPTTPWTAEIGSTGGGIQWGAPWIGSVPYGPVQAWPGEILRITASGLTPGAIHQARWIGAADDAANAQPVWPIALGTPVTAQPVGGGSFNSDPIDFGTTEAVHISALGGLAEVSVAEAITSAVLDADPSIQGGYVILQFADNLLANQLRLFLSHGSGNGSRSYLLADAVRGATTIHFRFGYFDDITGSEIRIDDYNGTPMFQMSDSGAGATLRFFTGVATGQGTVTGSRGGNLALASLLNALAGYGLIIDNSVP